VSKGAEDPETAFTTYLEKFSLLTLATGDIIQVTGPALLSRLEGFCFSLGRLYPDTMTMEWHPLYYLEMGCSEPWPSLDNVDLRASDSVIEQFILYVRKLSNASYILRFGKSHPFYMKLIDHLRVSFPYASPGFKALMKQMYDEQATSREGIVIENWLDGKISALTEDRYYNLLQEAMSQIGIDDRLLTRNDLDFRI
jgi:hypothetical protein